MASNRHLSRIIVLQSLYEFDFAQLKMGKKLDKKKDFEKIIQKNYSEFAKSIDSDEFIRKLAFGILENKDAIDKIIEPAAPEWPIAQIALVDLETLRIGIYELIFLREVPPKVAINEAVEIAKAFGGENSSRFVNGVLGTVYRNSDFYNPKDDIEKNEEEKNEG
ncbi:MAG: transcription antitermination factor NusB [Patescibacteria group bacterium]|nr:transcription antitermination factor NusB [Patescibacteria group bacterium]